MEIMVSAYLDNNIGDDLMIKLLANKFREHNFYLYTNNSIVKNTYQGIENVYFNDPSKMIFELDKMDVFLSIGGSIFNDLNTIKGQISRIRKIQLIKKAKRRKLKIATLGCNLGPYNNKRGVWLTKKELINNDLITVRDKYSYNLLKTMKGIKNFHLADDIVYNFLPTLNKENRKTGLGVSVYRSLKAREHNLSAYKILASIIDKYIVKTQKVVRLFAFDTEKENDLAAAHHVLNFSEHKDKIEIIPYLGCEHNFIDKINDCEKFIAIRFHSAIIADILKVPFIPISYSNKMESFLKDRKYEGEKYLFDNLSQINTLEVVENIISGKELFKSFNENNSASKHFEEFNKLLSK